MPQSLEYEYRLSLVTRELDICKQLSSNDLKVRKRGLSELKKLLSDLNEEEGYNVDCEHYFAIVLKEDDYKRIWNGLFYFIWMSDQPLVQERDVETVSSLIHCLSSREVAMLYVRGFFVSLTEQWTRISHYRSDKFLMFIRRFIRQLLIYLSKCEWNTKVIELFNEELYSAFQILPFGLICHIIDIYIEEIAKVTSGNIRTDILILLLKSYIKCIVNLKPSMKTVNYINANIFSYLSKQLKIHLKQKRIQTSDDNESEDEKNNSEEENSVESESDEEREILNDEKSGDNISSKDKFDRRAGQNNLAVPHLEFDEKIFVSFIKGYLPQCKTSLKAKNILTQIINMFESITSLR